MKERRTKHRGGEIHLGLRDELIKLGDHIAYFWESERQFEEAVGFLLRVHPAAWKHRLVKAGLA